MSRFENYNCVIKKHVDFWNHSPVREPLVAQMPFTGWKPKPYPLSGGREVIQPKQIAPADIDIDRLLGLDIQTPPAITDNIITTAITGAVSSKGTEIFIGILEIIELNISRDLK